MDNRENRAAASFEVRAVDDVTVSVEGYAAVINLTTNLFILVVSVAEKSEANCLHGSGTKQSASRYLPLQTLVATN